MPAANDFQAGVSTFADCDYRGLGDRVAGVVYPGPIWKAQVDISGV
jgi:hypothetical protein